MVRSFIASFPVRKGVSWSIVDIPPPWLARVASIKEAASHNVDTERKVVRMSEELKDLLREVKIRVHQLFKLHLCEISWRQGSNFTRIRSQSWDPRASSGSNSKTSRYDYWTREWFNQSEETGESLLGRYWAITSWTRCARSGEC